jgi:hypothetical protein
MRIGIFSDTHDHLDRIERAVTRFEELGCGLVLHGGDVVAPFALRPLRRLRCKVVAVFGDNDGNHLDLSAAFFRLGRIGFPPHAFEAEGRRLLLLHRPDGLDSFVRSQDYDLVVYGHLHRAEVRQQGRTTVVNPGEGSGWQSGRPTIACYDTVSGEAEVLDLEPAGGAG